LVQVQLDQKGEQSLHSPITLAHGFSQAHLFNWQQEKQKTECPETINTTASINRRGTEKEVGRRRT
jgi:hypothetical protein